VKSDKIEQWIKEIEERPSSAPLILQYISNRLRELTARNEELLAEVIALQSGNRVEEYEKRIAYLDYQLELLKRQVGDVRLPDTQASLDAGTLQTARADEICLLIYDAGGSVLRLEFDRGGLTHEQVLGRLSGALLSDPELPRLLPVQFQEELLFVFTSGRLAISPAAAIPAMRADVSPEEDGQRQAIYWNTVGIPNSLRPGEKLACIVPISLLSLAEWFVQVSRRGFLKKIRIAMADSILQNRYIGSGVRKPPDLSFDLLLSKNEDRLALVSWEGYLVSHDVSSLPVSLEPVVRIGTTDHMAAVLPVVPGRSVYVVTNPGKIIQLTDERFEAAETFKTRGLSLFSARRREEGVRVIGVAAVKDEDWCCVLDRSGELSVHQAGELANSGAISGISDILAFCSISRSATGG
jgi:DNA gyrase/topoisomerase IV subunit A